MSSTEVLGVAKKRVFGRKIPPLRLGQKNYKIFYLSGLLLLLISLKNRVFMRIIPEAVRI